VGCLLNGLLHGLSSNTCLRWGEFLTQCLHELLAALGHGSRSGRFDAEAVMKASQLLGPSMKLAKTASDRGQ
jgi:hypothetical protein